MNNETNNICPHCEEELSYIHFSQENTIREYGSIDLPIPRVTRTGQLATPDLEYADQEIIDTGQLEYYCPSCGENLSEDEINNIQAQIERPPTELTRPFAVELNNTTTQPIKCPNCNYEYQDSIEIGMICPQCSHTWTPSHLKNSVENNKNNTSP